jgi:TolA-binding protein
MKNFCPECGAKLEKDYKFCPNCGSKLDDENAAVQGNSTGATDNKSNKVTCRNCGEENDVNNTICSSCGIILDIKGSKPKNQAKKISGSKKTDRNIKVQKNQDKKGKTLDTKMFLIIFSSVVVAAAVIIISSGVLNTPPESITNTSQVNSNQQGVDLSSINKINEIEAQLKTNPGNSELRLQLAHTQNDAGFFSKAIENYKKYLEKNPKDADARIDMGVCYYNLHDYPTAINEMEEALKYQPNHQIGILNLGIVNLASGNLNKSKEWLEKAVAINPNSDAGKRAEELLKSHENNGGN